MVFHFGKIYEIAYVRGMKTAVTEEIVALESKLINYNLSTLGKIIQQTILKY